MTKIYEDEGYEGIDTNTIQRIRLHWNPKNTSTLIDGRKIMQLIGTRNISSRRNYYYSKQKYRKNRKQNDLKIKMTVHPLKIFLYHIYPDPMIKCKTLLSGNNIVIERPHKLKKVNIFEELNLFDYQNLIKINQN